MLGLFFIIIRLLILLHIDHTQVELRNGNTAMLYNRSRPSNCWVLAQSILSKKSIVFFFQAICLLSILLRLFEQFQEGALALIGLLEF